MEQQTAAAEVEEGKKKCCELTTPGGSKVSGCCAPCCWCCCVVVCEPMLSSAQVDKVIQKKSEAMIKRTVTQTLRDVVVTTGDAPTGESMERERGLTLSVRQAGDTSQRTSIAPPRASSDGGEIELARSKSKFSKSTGLEEGWGRPTDAAEPAIAAETAGPDPPMDHMEEWSVIDDGSDMKRERAESVKMIEPLNLVSGPEEADVFDPSLMSREQAGSESERIAVDLMQRKDDTAACEAAVSKLAAIGAAFKVDAKYPCPLIANEGASQSMFTALSHLLAHGTDEAMQHASIAICHLLEQTPPIKSRTPTFIATLEKLGPAMIYFVAQSVHFSAGGFPSPQGRPTAIKPDLGQSEIRMIALLNVLTFWADAAEKASTRRPRIRAPCTPPPRACTRPHRHAPAQNLTRHTLTQP